MDNSDIIKNARLIVEENGKFTMSIIFFIFIFIGLSDKIVLIRGRVEDVELPVPKVDIIISEWMVRYASSLLLFLRLHVLVLDLVPVLVLDLDLVLVLVLSFRLNFSLGLFSTVRIDDGHCDICARQMACS